MFGNSEFAGSDIDARGSYPGVIPEADISQSLARLKGWIDRRLKPRRQVNISVLILHGDSVQSALLCDLSETGFGLAKTSGLIPDEQIVITLPDGRNCSGRVVWVAKDRAGVAMISQS